MNIHHIHLYCLSLKHSSMLCCPTCEQNRKLESNFAIRAQPSWLWTPASPWKFAPVDQGEESQDSTSFLERTFGRGNTFFDGISFKEPKVGTGNSMKKWCHTVLFGCLAFILSLAKCFAYRIFWFRFLPQTMARTWQFRLMFFQNTLGR